MKESKPGRRCLNSARSSPPPLFCFCLVVHSLCPSQSALSTHMGRAFVGPPAAPPPGAGPTHAVSDGVLRVAEEGAADACKMRGSKLQEDRPASDHSSCGRTQSPRLANLLGALICV